MPTELITEKIDSHAFSGPVDVEKSDRAILETDTPDGSLIEAPPMTFKRLMVLFSLTNLFIGAGVAVLFLGAGLSIPLIYTSNCRRLYCRRHWWWKLAIGVANTLSVAAVSPIAGSISDLTGRRHATLLASAFVCIGCVVVGTAHRMDVASGGSALTGIGSGLAETVGAAGLLELAPAKSLTFGAALTYGIVHAVPSNYSSIVSFQHMALGSVAPPHVRWPQCRLAVHLLSPPGPSASKFTRTLQVGDCHPNRLCWDDIVNQWNRSVFAGNAMGRLQLVRSSEVEI
jgi:MFS family permease